MISLLRYLLLMMLFASKAISQEWINPLSSGYYANEVFTSPVTNPLAMSYQPACIASLRKATAGVMMEQRFGLTEMKSMVAAVALKLPSAGLVLQTKYMGYAASNQLQAGLSYGRKINEKVSVGAGIYYWRLSQAGIYGSGGLVSADIGVMLRPGEKIAFTFYSFNPFRFGSNKPEGFRQPSIYRFGAGYAPSEKVLLAAELMKEDNIPVSVSATIDYVMVNALRLKMGMHTGNHQLFAGIGWMFKHFRFDIIAGFHQQLGISPATMLVAPFGKQIDE